LTVVIVEGQTLINGGFAVIIAGTGWFARQIWDAVEKLKNDLQRVEVALPSQYVSKVEYGATMARIETKLEKILDRLDEKADKS
jgi:hypothetical protein